MESQDRGARGPLVSVVTPFYNTEPYLAECIESVLGQSLERFEYVLVDNRSTDGSLEIARRYADADPRIRLATNERHLSQLENYNTALSRISPASRYCKIVQADDWIYPECLERLVSVAESDDGIGLVSSYSLEGTALRGDGLPPDRAVFSGREICRRQLLAGDFFFGSPTTVLFRASIVRDRAPEFFSGAALHFDTDVCYDILQEWKFGFVHQVLSYMRVDDDSITGRSRGLNPRGLDKLVILLKFGRRFLDEDEYKSCLRRHEARYYREYVKNIGSRKFRRYHGRALRSAGYSVKVSRVALAAGLEAMDIVFNPKHTLSRLVHAARSTVRW